MLDAVEDGPEFGPGCAVTVNVDGAGGDAVFGFGHVENEGLGAFGG